MQKRLISMVLALSMALTAMPLPALAQSAPPDTASAAALAEENGEITNIYTSNSSGKPIGDLGDSGDSWSYDEASNTLTLKKGTFCLRNYGYDSYNNCIKWNVKIEPGATLQEARIGSEYHNGYTVTNAGTISGGTFYGKVICEAGAVISGGTFKGNAIVNAAGGEVTIEDGTFEEGSYTSGMTVKAAGILTINGGTFKGKRTCSVDIDNCEKIVINGGSFESALTDLERTTEIIINGGLFNDKLYVAGDKCTVNGGYFTAKSTGLVAIDATDVPVYAPVAVAADGTVTEWSADAYSTLYVVSGKPVTLRPTYKLKSVVSGGEELNYNDGNGAVSFTVGAEAVQLNSVIWEELVIEADGFPKGTDGGVYGAKGNTVEIDLCYTEQDGMTPANYVEDLPLDAAFDKALLQKVPSRLCAQVLCDGKPTEADMQTVLHTLKQVLESNDMPITYYDITLVPTGDYADHSAFMADVLESGLTSADTIA